MTIHDITRLIVLLVEKIMKSNGVTLKEATPFLYLEIRIEIEC